MTTTKQDAQKLMADVTTMIFRYYKPRIESAHAHGWKSDASRLHQQMHMDIDRATAPMRDIICREIAREPISITICLDP